MTVPKKQAVGDEFEPTSSRKMQAQTTNVYQYRDERIIYEILCLLPMMSL